jgi:hypothetical protein
MAVTGNAVLNLRQFMLIVSILESFKDYHTLLEVFPFSNL